MLARMSLAVLVQRKVSGRHGGPRSATKRNTPRLRARSVSSAKNRSTWLIHEADVGVKCTCRHGHLANRTFSTNNGSDESLKVSTRCGCSPKACQMRLRSRARGRSLWPWSAGSSALRLSEAFQRLADRGCDLIVADLARRARARLVVEAIHPALREAIAPCAGRCGTDTHLDRDLLVVEPSGRSENDTRPLRQRLRCAVLARQRRIRSSPRLPVRSPPLGPSHPPPCIEVARM